MIFVVNNFVRSASRSRPLWDFFCLDFVFGVVCLLFRFFPVSKCKK